MSISATGGESSIQFNNKNNLEKYAFLNILFKQMAYTIIKFVAKKTLVSSIYTKNCIFSDFQDT